MPKGVYKRTPKHNAAVSKALKGIPKTPETCTAMSKATLGVPKPPRTPEHCAALSEALKNSDAHKAASEKERGGNDLVTHHYIYDHNDLSLNTVQISRKDHSRLHRLLKKLGYVVPHIESNNLL